MQLPTSMPRTLGEKVTTSPMLVVGAGGIGCELLKNLVLTGFKSITIIDLDTIDVTNLNRQFLFHKRHVGQPKSRVAKESALTFVPDSDITAIHGSITTSEYGVSFYKQFAMVLNALDNRAARSHVNRMCLAADVPLVESGTAGYLGQVTVIRKKRTECYDCQPKPHQKSFPGCTIRNTPSEPIHCIVWSKHLFNQLFGEADPDEDVSPDTEDPELSAEGEGGAKKAKPEDRDGNVQRVNTRQWAVDNDHDPRSIFQKLFCEDIKYLLSMDKLWTKRTPPVPLEWDSLDGLGDKPASDESEVAGGIKDQTLWTLQQCRDVFASAVGKLRDRLKATDFKDHLVWDKDDEAAMDFVAACSNIRSHVFKIAHKTRFDIKSMAGNIIPAIATTNAIIAGCIVMEALKILNGQADRCRMVFLSRKPNPRHKILVPCQLPQPNPKCYVCADKPEVSIRLDMAKMTLKAFEEKVLKGVLNMVAPDAEVDGKGVVLISSEDREDGEGEGSNESKPLKDFGLADGSVLVCDDFLQDYNVKVFLYQADDLPDGEEFQVVGDIQKLGEEMKKAPEKEETNGAAGPSKNGNDDVEVVEVANEAQTVVEAKKRAAEPATDAPKSKKLKTSAAAAAAEDDVVCLE